MSDSYAAKQKQRKCINKEIDDFFKKGGKAQNIPTLKHVEPASYPVRVRA